MTSANISNSRYTAVYSGLHKIEEQVIEISGLVEALQKVLPDGAAHTCVANAIEEKLKSLQLEFSEHWKILTENEGRIKHNNLTS